MIQADGLFVGGLPALRAYLGSTVVWLPEAPVQDGYYRYWRIHSNSMNSGAGSAIAEIEMASSIGGPNECGSGTPTGSGTVTFNPVANAFDNNPATVWQVNNNDGLADLWCQYDFGAGNEKAIRELRITPGSVSTAGQMNSFMVQVSNNGFNWTTIWYTGPHPSNEWEANVPKVFYIESEEGKAILPYENTYLYHFDASEGVYRNETDLAEDNDLVSKWANKGTGVDLLQATAESRLTYKTTGGLNNKPYLVGSTGKNFSPVPFVTPLSVGTPTIHSQYWVVEDANDLSIPNGLIGVPGNNLGGKVAIYFRSNPNEQFHILRNSLRLGTVPKELILGVSQYTNPLTCITSNDSSLFQGAPTGNYASGGGETIQFFRTRVDNVDRDFRGKVYEVIFTDNPLRIPAHLAVVSYLLNKYSVPENGLDVSSAGTLAVQKYTPVNSYLTMLGSLALRKL